MKKKNGFTLIELLAVIIILGILMIIAIPSVTKYISDSRKNSYVDSAKEIIGSARNLVNSGELEMYDTDATYYIDVNCIKTENAMKSPYGDFTNAYVVVTYDGKGYSYFWTSVDDAGQGVKNIVKYDKLDTDSIESDLTSDDINTKRTIDGRGKVIIIDEEHSCKKAGFDDQGLINVNSETGEEGGSSGGSGGTPSNIVCKPATTLHTKTCNRSDSLGCNATGSIGNGNTITYGTLVSGSPKAGDAYDCKVTQDGDYTERFYYVGSEGNNSILIYYTNMNDQTMYAYDSSNENWHGPRTGYQYLPSTSEWDNPGLIAPGTRSIVAENGNGSTSGGAIESFTYEGKAARFLTYQEVASACGSSGMNADGYLNNCTWLMENLGQYEGSSGAYGYWLETPRSSRTDRVCRVLGNSRAVYFNSANSTTYVGARPVITVLTSNISN